MSQAVVDTLLAKIFSGDWTDLIDTINHNSDSASSGGIWNGSTWARHFQAAPGVVRILQPVWDMRLVSEKSVASPLFPIVVSLSLYILCVLPFMIVDMYGRQWTWIQKYKIQTDREVLLCFPTISGLGFFH